MKASHKFVKGSMIASAIFAIIVAVEIWGQWLKRDPFVERFKLMSVEMTTTEVGTLMEGYPIRKREEPMLTDSRDQKLPRPSMVLWTIDEKPGAKERDHCITAHFDKDGRLVGKELQTYVK